MMSLTITDAKDIRKNLEAVRTEMFENFARKAEANPKYNHWFPKKNGGELGRRDCVKLVEEFTRTDRRYFSPVFAMRRVISSGRQVYV